MKVILLMAMTVDGKIARTAEHFPDWTGSADKRFFKSVSQQAGVVIMGSKTFDTFSKPLPKRKNIVMTRNPERRSRWPNLAYTDQRPAAILKDLEQEGFTEAILAGGAKINSLFARDGLIDEMILTYVPLIFGAGISLFAAPLDLELALVRVQTLENDLLVARYRVLK